MLKGIILRRKKSLENPGFLWSQLLMVPLNMHAKFYESRPVNIMR